MKTLNLNGVEVIIGTLGPPIPQTFAVSIPTSIEQFSPQPLVLMPMRWARQSKQVRREDRARFLMRKVLHSNVGRKFRRYLRRHNAALVKQGIAYGWGGRRILAEREGK